MVGRRPACLTGAAYMAEICRAGLLAVDVGQTDAPQTLGVSCAKTLRRIWCSPSDTLLLALHRACSPSREGWATGQPH